MEISTKRTLVGEHDYLRVARTLRDKLDGLITLGATDPETQRKILLDVLQELAPILANNATHKYNEISTCTHSCYEHEEIMNPSLWSMLPIKLLLHVFAKLPFANIYRLKSLSKEWQSSLQSSSSEFTLVLKESCPIILVGVTQSAPFSFGLHVLDERNNRWQDFSNGIASHSWMECSLVQWWVHMIGTTNARLVCYVEKDIYTDLNSIFVTNPMTGVVNRLPILNVMAYSALTMMRIIVDCNTYHYKVIVVKYASSVEAEVYNSEVQQWTKLKPSLGRIFGFAHHWYEVEYQIGPSHWNAREYGPCTYDCRNGKYYDFGQDCKKWLGENVMSYTLLKDRLFVLQWNEREDAALILEYSVLENATSWVKERMYNCVPRILRQPSWLTSTIYAFVGFLFVFQNTNGPMCDNHNPRHENGWIYDLATCKWRALPMYPWESTGKPKTFFTNLMCELHWNIRP